MCTAILKIIAEIQKHAIEKIQEKSRMESNCKLVPTLKRPSTRYAIARMCEIALNTLLLLLIQLYHLA